MWIRVFLTATLLIACCGAQTDDQQVWKHFVEWYKTYPRTTDMPPQIMKAYAASLASSGLTPEQIKERMEMVAKTAAGSPRDLMSVHFNKIYTTPEAPFSTEPNGFMVRMVEGLKPGKALDVGMGQGRNAVYLAQKGWDVTGYDISEKGLAEAQALAAKAGVKIQTLLKGHDEFDFGRGQWDLVVMAYSFAPMTDAFLKRVKESLKPEGIVLVEQFNSPSTSGAKGAANALLKSFEDLRIVHYEDTVATAEWGPARAETKSRIGRVAAQRDK